MSPSSVSESTPELCEQCCILFSVSTLRDLMSSKAWFRHSHLDSFEHRTGCQFCRFLWEEDLMGADNLPRRFRRLRDLVYPPPGTAKLRNAKNLVGSWVAVSCLELGPGALGGQLDYLTALASASDDSAATALRGGMRIFVRVENTTGRMFWDFPHLRGSAAQEDPCAALTCFRPLAWNGLSLESAPLLKAMLDKCETSHSRCQPRSPQPLPSRLVHVPSDYLSSQRVRLYVTPKEGQLGQYVALSYCWGGPQTFSLKHDNLERLQHEATHASALPQTLQDAILVAHHLGFEYLWIDALCIIQDSVDDKLREIGEMQNTYQSAAVTIAAATASSVNQGFLNPPAQFSNRYPSCSVPVTFTDGTRNQQGGTLTISPQHAQNTKDFPINKRGWTYQEALLSPRLLVFGDLEPFLRCQTKEATLPAPTCIAYDARAIQPPRFAREMQSGPGYNVLDEDGASVDLRLEFQWPRLVEQYTRRELGLWEDRPHAIAGVVRALARITGDACWYGVWKSCPVACLLWAVDSEGDSARVAGVPTWSWMSVTAPVELNRVQIMKEPEAAVEWDDGADLAAKTLCISCRVAGEEDVLSAPPGGSAALLEWDLDVGEVGPMPEGDSRRPAVSEPLYFLVIARQVDQKLFAFVATSSGGGVYHRRGIAELKSTAAITSKPRQRINLE